jgi:hypothetical protein
MPEGLVHTVTVPASTGHHPCKTPPQLCLRDHPRPNAPCPMILLLPSCSCGRWSSTQHKTLEQNRTFFGGTTSLGSSPPPTDVRPLEERFQVQLQVRTLPCAPHSPWNNTDSRLQQLQDMGFMNASQNVRALLATGGNDRLD